LGIHVLLANLLLARADRKKVVFSFGSARKDSLLVHWYFRLADRYGDCVTANSPSVASGLREHGMKPSLIELLPNGHDPKRYSLVESKAELRVRLGLPQDKFILVTTGRLIPSKRHCDLLESFKAIKTIHNVQLVIVGDGQLDSILEAQALSLGISDDVKFVGFQNDVPAFLKVADLFVFPSETEGLPNSLIEASLARLPIVACDAPGVVDVIEHEVNGLRVSTRSPDQLADAVNRLLSNPELARRLALKAEELATEKYCLSSVIQQVESIYSRVLTIDE
jgi:glycosyltransferase involved in cell wall biosynthesis